MFERGSGILMHITSLPSGYGIGDMGPVARQFADMLVEAGQHYWQMLPLNPSSTKAGNSPYFSASAFAGDVLLISQDMLVSVGLLESDDCAVVPGNTNDTLVDFDAVRKWKIPLIEKACARGLRQKNLETFRAFCREQAWWLDDYALFAAIKEMHSEAPWFEWPEDIRNQEAAAMERARVQCQERIEVIRFGQFLFFGQWIALRGYCNERGLKLIGDVPIYVNHDSADVWGNRHLFKLDVDGTPTGVSGVPPDYFSATGQLWNNPVYNWEALRERRFDWWVRRMAATFERFDIVRIDHFRGLVQYWEVPAGEATAINGTWMDVPTYELFDSMLKRIPGFPVIAEDLGTITPDVVDAMEHYGFPGMKVLLFAFGEDNPSNPYLPHNHIRNCFVYTGTHDNNTFRGWWETEATEADRERFMSYIGKQRGSVEEVCRDMIRLAQSSVADVVVVPVQDLLCLPGSARMNHPAKATGNWRWRLTPDELTALPLAWLREIATRYGRFSQKPPAGAQRSSVDVGRET